MSHGTFATALNCMDGRTQLTVNEYARNKYGVDFVDTITEAGIDAVLPGVEHGQDLYEATKRKVLISVDKHGSKAIVVAGHEDCAGNPVEREQHIADIKASVAKVREMIAPKELPVQGVYVTLHPEIRVEEISQE